jgi:poly-gamma-glutamate biosynthesis protein PgsC/CapC
VLTAALSIGVVVSLILTEAIGLVPGGIIVPGYLAMILDRPAALFTTLILTALTWLLLKLAARFMVLYSRRRFGVAVLIGLALSSGMQLLRPQLTGLPLEWTGIGYVVPGLIAHQCDRQGIWQTVVAIAISVPVVRLLIVAFG